MGLFDFFRKKKTDSTFPENELEKHLLQASKDMTAQKRFYQRLLWSDLYVLTHDRQEDGRTTLEKGEKVKFIVFEGGEIPIFSSTNRIFDKSIIKEEVAYMKLQAQDLFELAVGATFVLNPYSKYVKELVPQEVEDLLNGSIYDNIDKQIEDFEKAHKFKDLYNGAMDKLEGLVAFGGYHVKQLKDADRLKLEESISDLEKCLELYPENWQSMMFISKALQSLERHAESLEYLEHAFKVEEKDHTIPLEAAIEAMHLEDFDKALFYSEESLKRKPNDYELMGNYAMNLLIAKKDNQAKEIINQAIELSPSDKINRNVKHLIDDVISGKRERPTFKDTVK